MRIARIATAIVIASWASGAFAQSPASVRAEVNGMVCAFCAAGVEKKLKALPATQAVYVNLEKRVVAVAPKDGARLSTAEVAAKIREAGYDVVKVAESDRTLAQIRTEVTGKR